MKVIIILFCIFGLNPSFAAPAVPKLKSGEVAVFIKDKYEVQRFRKFQSLELSQVCFKGKSPQCEAFIKTQKKPAIPKPKDDLIYNPAAITCQNFGGKAVVGVTAKKSEVELCLFKDGSLVKSWGAFYKHFPKQVIKK